MSRLNQRLTGRRTLEQLRQWRYPLSFLLLGTVLVTGAIAARTFGSSGRRGFSGNTGRTGESGPDQTLIVDGQPKSLQLMGYSGTDGGDGGHGEDARHCSQPSGVSHNLRGASGGDGGNGGDGGDGGDGGNVKLYYQELEALGEIFVDARGGQGGYGGYGGYGGRGCSCRRRSWTVNDRRYRCTSGSPGRRGRNGRTGEDGTLGRLRIVEGTTPLEPEQPTAELRLSDFERPLALSKNVWLRRGGARSLLASGSVVAEEYEEFVERLERSVALAWESDRPQSQFSDLDVSLTLTANDTIEASFPDDLWVQGSVVEEEGLTTYQIDTILREAEATELAIADANRNPRQFNLALVDTAQQSEILDTEFAVKIRSTGSRVGFRHMQNYQTRYEGEIPAHLVSREHNRFVLDLSGLPLETRDFPSRAQVEVELLITRRLGDHEAEQTVLWQGQLD